MNYVRLYGRGSVRGVESRVQPRQLESEAALFLPNFAASLAHMPKLPGEQPDSKRGYKCQSFQTPAKQLTTKGTHRANNRVKAILQRCQHSLHSEE